MQWAFVHELYMYLAIMIVFSHKSDSCHSQFMSKLQSLTMPQADKLPALNCQIIWFFFWSSCSIQLTYCMFTCLLYLAAAQSLVQLLHDTVDEEVMSQFVQTFLLESNSTAVRWQAHELLYSMHKYVHCTHVHTKVFWPIYFRPVADFLVSSVKLLYHTYILYFCCLLSVIMWGIIGLLKSLLQGLIL